jgi:hypothetical protein
MSDRPADATTYSLAPGRGSPGSKRRKSLRAVLLALLVLLLGFVPYPTQVFPAVSVQLVDERGQSLRQAIPARWRGVCNAAIIEGDASFDESGRLSLPARRVWATPYRRAAAASGLLHKLRGTYADFRFTLPAGYELDTGATGLIQTRPQWWELPTAGDRLWYWRDPVKGASVEIWMNHFGRDRTTAHQLIVRRLQTHH